MWYIITNGILAALVLIDATRRQMKSPPLWGLATFFLGPFTLAAYLSRRPLMADEFRSGGYIWSLSKYFSLAWSMLMLLLALSQIFQFNNSDGIMQMLLRQSGLNLVSSSGIVLHAKLWLAPVVVAMLLGILCRRRRTTEVGPTGPLAWSTPIHEEVPTSGLFIGLPTR